jgi:dihydroflavonol-4-reductase
MAAYLRGAGLNVVGVDDVARGHLLALERGRSGERYILGGENLPLGRVFALALDAVGREPPRLAVPWPAVYGAALVAAAAGRAASREPQLLVLDEVRLARVPLYFSSDKARAELGYEPRAAVDALATAAKWFADASEPRSSGRLSALARLRPPLLRRPAGGW